MDMSNIPLGDIVVSYVDMQPINTAMEQRFQALASQLSEEAASQLMNDSKAIECSVESAGNSLNFKTNISESYLMNYLQNHGTPEAGGDDGTAHNVDGSTYQSHVPSKFWGTPLPWLELPVIDCEAEAKQLLAIMAHDAAQNGVANGMHAIKSTVVPILKEEIVSVFGGG